MRAQFELKPLTANDINLDDLPNGAIECSAWALNIFQTFYAEIEDMRNASKYLAVQRFFAITL